MIDHTELRKLAEAATPGVWRVGQPITNGHVTVAYIGTDCDRLTSNGYNFETRYSDAKFIAAANPQTVLALLDRLARAEMLVADARRFRWLVNRISHNLSTYRLLVLLDIWDGEDCRDIRAAIDAEMGE